ncbi:AtpZ/AtpI family protein [Algoriphagus sp. SE2]|uniref:AtpZ/AtpI family protein n=1 Tax=Algoriphagus sp. SE2 TaxID=3141536 RepID=UPI0031CD6928
MDQKNIKNTPSLSHQVADKERRKIAAQKDKRSVWAGLGLFGIVGWSVVVPTMSGALLGIWLDSRYPQSFSWTLSLLVAGLLLGCLMAWNWIKKEHDEINEKSDKNE